MERRGRDVIDTPVLLASLLVSWERDESERGLGREEAEKTREGGWS